MTELPDKFKGWNAWDFETRNWKQFASPEEISIVETRIQEEKKRFKEWQTRSN